jgi:hypothetical protein
LLLARAFLVQLLEVMEDRYLHAPYSSQPKGKGSISNSHALQGSCYSVTACNQFTL